MYKFYINFTFIRLPNFLLLGTIIYAYAERDEAGGYFLYKERTSVDKSPTIGRLTDLGYSASPFLTAEVERTEVQ